MKALSESTGYPRIVLQSAFLAIASLLLLSVTPCKSQENAPPSPTPPPAAESSAAAVPKKTMGGTPFDVAIEFYREMNFGEAATAFEKIAQSGAADAPRAYAWLARCELKLGRIAEAEASAQKAVAAAPNLATAHSALGEVYFREGKFPEAEKEFLTPLKAGVADPRAYLGEATLSRTTSNYKHAKQLVDKARALDPQDPDIFAAWASTLTRVERVKAVGNVDKADGADVPEHSCKLVTPITSTEASLERLMLNADQFRGFGLAVKVNGQGSKLLLDTGASGILLNSKLAQRAGVKHISDTKIGGFGDQGGAGGYVAYADTIQVGGLEFKGCLIAVVDKKRSMGEDGLIGADVFRNFLVDIDFPDEKLKLSELPKPPGSSAEPLNLQSEENAPPALYDRYIAPEMQSWERFYRFGHMILLPTYVNTTGSTHLFLVDTGSYENNLSVDFARKVTKVHTDEMTTVVGLSGKVKNVYRADQVTIGFPYSKLSQKSNDIVALDLSDMSNSVGTELSGVLGFSLLWMLDIKLDYRDGLASFTYKPNHMH